MTPISKRLAHPLTWRRDRPSDVEAEQATPAQNVATRPSRALPIAVLAALGTTSLASPAAADVQLDRGLGELAKRTTTPTMVVLGAPSRSSVTVKEGETLSHVSARTGVSVDALRRANGVGSNDMIYADQKLSIPSKGSGGSSTSSGRSSGGKRSGSGGYSVRSGDTLTHIAQRQGVSVAALQAANPGVNPQGLQIGQKLSMPKGGASTSSGRTSSGKRSGSGGYSVRSGDTLTHIAQRQGVSVAALQAANPGVNPQGLQIGQKLSMPKGGTAASSTGKKRAIGNTFAGRTYPEDTVRAANANHSSLAARSAPSRDSMRQTIASTARRHGVDPSLAQAVAYQESGFNQRAVSPANAVGAMQVTPSAGRWASEMAGRDLDLLDPQDNATAGVLVLKANLRAGGDERTALAGYYQGLSSVRKNGMYPDTVQYVNSAQRHKARYR